ncbi:MAG: DUF1679 domain-containing protein [Patescibacteria group bacterium]|nr:DUF1679 domain-containing protein [Patescibacteria group bacterium]MDD4610339.1 DUF1679 domain-containing protein [Patescibacteria group bacterium]
MEKSKNIETPQSPSEITVEWLKTILPQKISNEIISIEADEKFRPNGHLGKIEKININYAVQNQNPGSVIIKFQKCSNPKKEAEIYQLLENAGVSYIPHLYGKFGEGNLVLEDLSSTHSVQETFTIDQIRQVLSLLADLDSRFWGDSKIPKDNLSHFVNSININFEKGWNKFKNRCEKELGGEIADFEWMWKNREIISSYYNSSPTTMCHGDVNRSNLLFPNDKKNKPILIDWQLSGQKVLPFDLSYFLVKALTVEQRREYEENLLEEYYNLLPEKIKSNYSYSDFILDYRACATRSMLSAVTKFGPIFENDFSNEAADNLSKRVIEAVRDIKPIEAIQELRKYKKF